MDAVGESLKDAIETVDDETDGAPAYFMIGQAQPFRRRS
jgi:homocysteine S-methyltransferase